jgi:CheY-like chemotaxis protein
LTGKKDPAIQKEMSEDDDAAPSSPRPARARRILVVDDNEDGATMLATLLSLDGHDVRTALSGSQAVETATATRPDLVLLDIGLPEMDGYEVARCIRTALGERTPTLVAITGYGRENDRERTRSAGFAAHLVKPVSFEELRRVISDLD